MRNSNELCESFRCVADLMKEERHEGTSLTSISIFRVKLSDYTPTPRESDSFFSLCAGLRETIRLKEQEVQHEIPHCCRGDCGIACCERLGSLFLCEKQRPSDRTDCVHSCAVDLSHCDCRLALPREPLFRSCCQCRPLRTVRSSHRHSAPTVKSLK